MNNKKDLTGKRFGKLLVLKEDGHIGEKIAWLCKCDCGNIKRINGNNLGRSAKSCGCVKTRKLVERNLIHGLHNNKLYVVWFDMKRRCKDPRDKAYKHYGGRGISVCKEWCLDFKVFYDWSQKNGYKDGLTLDRIDNDGNYTPDNCRWVTQKEQCRNKRTNHFVTYKGQKMILKDLAKLTGLSPTTIRKYEQEYNFNYDLMVKEILESPHHELGKRGKKYGRSKKGNRNIIDV